MKEFIRLGSWGCFSGPSLGRVLSSFGRPVSSVAGRVPPSVVFTSSGVSVCFPLADEGVGLGPSSSGPVASHPPLAVRSASAASSTSAGGCRPGWFH